MTFGVGAAPRPIHFQRAMVFIDGTNLFHRLESAKLKLMINLNTLIGGQFVQGRQIIRTYLYTIKEHLDKAITYHGDNITKDIRVVLGDSIKLDNGGIKEKGVDALLVADLVYHAAVKNYDYALLVSVDTDFVHPIRRIENFGCRTAVLGVCSSIPERLKMSCDVTWQLPSEILIQNKWASPRE